MHKPRSRSLRHIRTPEPKRLAKTLKRIAPIALGTSLGISSGCTPQQGRDLSQDVPRPQGDAGPKSTTSEWQSISCDGFQPELLVAELAARDVDYVALFYQFSEGQDANTGKNLVYVRAVTQSGNPCSAADDAGSCLMPPPSAACVSDGICGPFVLVARGDQLARIDTRAGLLSWLGGKINTGEEAVLLALFDGHNPYCANGASGQGTQTRAAGDGFDVQTISFVCRNPSPQLIESYHVSEGAELTQTEGEPSPVVPGAPCTGRRPEGLCAVPRDRRSRSALGAFFASAAQLEAASVFAFARLARELHALRAPAALSSAAVRALADEVLHTRLMGALAQRFGARVQAPAIAPMPERSPFAIALENAVEGCVRESYGALLAQHQAATASDPEIKQVMTILAHDEARHALLAWQVGAWLEPRLSQVEQRELTEVRVAALAQLSGELDSGLSRGEDRRIGWPTRSSAARLLLQLTAALA